MRDRGAGAPAPPKKRVRVRSRPAPPRPKPDALTHRQQQIVHQAREIVQSPTGSKQHRDAARRLADLNLSQHEHELAARAARQHAEHLDRMRAHQHAARGVTLEPIGRAKGRERTEYMPFALPGTSHELHYHEDPHRRIGHDLSPQETENLAADITLRRTGVESAAKSTQMSPVLRGLRKATQEILGPSITAYAHGEHASKKGLGMDVAMLVDPTKVVRGGHAIIEAARAGEGAVEALRAGGAAVRGGESARTLTKFRKTPEGKRATSDLKQHPDRADVHRQIDSHADLTPAQKRTLKKNFDDEVHDAVRASGKTVDELFSDPRVRGALQPFHGYPAERTAANLRTKLNPRLKSSGLQANSAVSQNGLHVLGPILPEEWVKRVLATIPDPEERRHLATWYEHAVPLFVKVFGDDAPRVLRGFAVSQANASPTFGMQAVLRVIDKVDRGLPVSKSEISAVSQSIEAAVKGSKVEKGVAAKLSDFIDSLLGGDTRTWMGHAPEGGAPTAIDVHAVRDLGYVDPKLVSRLEKRGLVQGRDFVVDSSGSPSGSSYERAVEQYESITDHLNQIHFDGRTDWKPSEVQALGWSSIQKFHGTTPEDLGDAVANNTREFMAPAKERELLSMAEEHSAYPQASNDGSVHAIVSPENGRELAQHMADEYGEARMLWLTNQAAARHVVLTVTGDLNYEQAARILRAGFTHVHESDGITRFIGPKSALPKGKLERTVEEARADGLQVDHAYTQMEEFHAGEGSRHHIPGGPADSGELMAQRAELRGRVHFAEGSGPVHVGQFLDALSRNPRAEFLTAHTADELRDSRVFLSTDGEAGFVISPEGDLQNVFNNVKGSGAGPAAIRRAIQEGAGTLDAYDGFLPELYSQYGFVETGRMKWDDALAPEGWDYEAMGRPDVVFMGYKARPADRLYDDYELAKADSREATLGKGSSDRGLSSGIDPGFRDDTERGLLGDWFSRIRGEGDELVTHGEYARNEPEGAATQALKGDDASRITAVQGGDKPAAIILDADEAKRAEDAGLVVEHDPLPDKYGGDYWHVARDEAAMKDVQQANRALHNGKTVVGDFLFGRAMGYSRDDVARYVAEKHGVELKPGVDILSRREAKAQMAASGDLVYHGTSASNADEILRTGEIRQGDDGRGHIAAWFADKPVGASFRGDVVFAVPRDHLGEIKVDRLGVVGAEHDVTIATENAGLKTSQQDVAAEKVMKGLKGASRTYREEKVLQSSERGVRAGLAQEAMAGVQGLEEKLIAAKTELEGALPKLEHDGIRGLSETEVDRVGELIENHPDLQFYERLRGMDALRNAWLGHVPTPSELRVLRTALGPKITKEMFEPTRLQKYRHTTFEILNMPRSLMASFDVSAPFRQGLVAFARHPMMTSKNLGPMLKYFGSEAGYQDLMRGIDARANRDLYARAKLAITDVEHTLEKREEQFMSQYAEKLNIPVGGGHSIGPGHIVRGSGRAYTGFLVETRADMFDLLVEKAEKAGWDVENDDKLLRDLGNYINAATGRGSLGKLEGAAVALNSTFFSPRLMASRLSFLNPYSYVGLHPFVRRQKLRAAFQLAAAVGAVLWLGNQTLGAKVGLDPFSADFGKLRFGDTRVDITGGFTGYVRMLGTLGMAMTGHDPDRKAQDALVRFFRGKLAPVPSTAAEVVLHTDYSGYRTPNYPTEIRNLFIPLVVQDTLKVVQNKDTLTKVGLTAAASAVGFGVNTYKDSTPKTKGKSRSEKESDFTTKYQAKFGRPLPAPVAQAQRTKEMYTAAEKRRKDELGVSKLTEEQRTSVKLAVLGSVRPDLRPAIRNFRGLLDQSDNSEQQGFVKSWAEDNLNWQMLEDFHAMLKDAGG